MEKGGGSEEGGGVQGEEGESMERELEYKGERG